jgi:hypothetical protein
VQRGPTEEGQRSLGTDQQPGPVEPPVPQDATQVVAAAIAEQADGDRCRE